MARESINLLQQLGPEVTGTKQVETATLVGTPSTGNATITVTAAGMTGSPKAISVALLTGDTLTQAAVKVANAIALDLDVSAMFSVMASGATVILTALSPAANDATLNIASTGAGLTPDATSDNTTAGVAASSPVAATKRFSSMMINITDAIETKQFRSWGAKANTISAIHKLWAKGSFNGSMNYVELCYILASLAPYAVSSLGSGAYQWDFLPNPTGSDTTTEFTLEDGDDEAVEQYKNMRFTSFEGSWGLDDITVSGDVLAKTHVNIGGLTAGVSMLAQKPVLRTHVNLYIDTAYGSIGTTKMADTFDGKFKIGEKFEPKWVLNTAEASYREAVEKIPEMTMTTVFEANSQGRAIVNDVTVNNTGRYLRLSSVGGLIGGAYYYTANFDMFGYVSDIRPQKDLNGVVYAYEVDWTAVHDDTMGRAWRVQVLNGLSAL